MRFFKDGPVLPDELLAARDEGNVLFFCGAGVSRAQANLPDFIGLARNVLRELRALPESPAYKLAEAVGRQEQIAGVGGLLPADRVFGLLERDFPIRAIEAAVGAVLKPAEGVDVDAHRIMLDLSTSPDRKTRLVTTNFDLLFEKAKPKLPVYTPADLRALNDIAAIEGIVHLHGMLDQSYSHSVGGNLVLSSGEFGQAYLADGWARDFIRTAFDKYTIVFVGYGADDPPVQYLLEALKRIGGASAFQRYAFQAGNANDASALWSQKGVTAIPYRTTESDHSLLWNSLRAWAERARNPDRWRKKILRQGKRGPEVLSPHERGQIFHLAMTEAGAQAIASSQPVLPANWLCVFDAGMRYATPGKINPMRAESPDIEPFDLFSIDSDPEPAPADPNQLFRHRELPQKAADVFASKPWDQRETAGLFRGYPGQYIGTLSPRLAALATWLWRVSDQPGAAWWAAGQAALHPFVIEQIKFALEHRDMMHSPALRRAWGYILESWQRSADMDHEVFAAQAALNKEGWTGALIRRLIDIRRCRLKVSRPYWRVLPPNQRGEITLDQLASVEIEYPERHVAISIPDEKLEVLVPLLRGNLEYAVDLNGELSPYPVRIAPIVPDPNLPGESSERDFGINSCLFEYVGVFSRLHARNKAAARNEYRAWRGGDDPAFGRLRIWAAGLTELLEPSEAAAEFLNSSETVFWGDRDQRDVLLALKARWHDISTKARRRIERRIISGPPKVPHATSVKNKLWHAIEVLDRITWLENEGCAFTNPTEEVVSNLRKVAPEWKSEHANRAADSNEARGGTVVTDKSIGALDEVPLDELIVAALAERQREWGTLTESDPFAGLSETRPLRLLAALAHEDRQGRSTKEPWTRFLYNSARRTDSPRLALLIARRLTLLSDQSLDRVVPAAACWLDAVKSLLHPYQGAALYELFDRLIDRIEASSAVPEGEHRKPGNRRDWQNVAFGSTAGHLSEVLLGDIVVRNLTGNAPFPDSWIRRGTRLLTLPNDHRRFSLVQFARYIGWIHLHAPSWIEERVLKPILGEGEDHDAALAGFLSNALVFDDRLYDLLKPQIVEMLTDPSTVKSRDTLALGSLLLRGWRSRRDDGARWLSDEELRRILILTDDDTRCHILWHVDHLKIEEKLLFLRQAWPLQLAVRSAQAVGRLCTIAFNDALHFRELADAIMPLVSDSNGDSLSLPIVHGSRDTITETHPEIVLALLATVLSYNARQWPYGIDKILAKIIDAVPHLARDARYLRLKALWDGRHAG